MPPIIDEQTDELKARRQRRNGRQEPPAVNGGTPPGQSAGAARDLLRGLITDGARRDEEGSSAATDAGSESTSAAPANPEREDRIASESTPGTAREGEAIDELIRRVKDSAAGMAVETSNTLQQRRPKGTADLARDAPRTRAAARRRVPETELRSTDVAPTPKKHRRVVAAIVLLAGVAVLLVTLVGTGGTSVPRRLDPSIASSRLAAARSGDFGGALPATIAAIAPELRAVARRAASSAAANRHGAERRRTRSRAMHARAKHRAAVVQRAPVTNSPPPSTTGTLTQSSSAAQAPASTASQTSAMSQPSATSNSRPAGPIGAGPLGGIGSCVKGC
jgi:hypothetical protein